MSNANFSTDLFSVVVNGRIMTAWGESDPPYKDSPIDQKSTLRRGIGGTACRLDRINPGRSVELNLNPGSADSAFMQALMSSNSTIVLAKTQIGTLEASVGTGGVIINDGEVGRGGTITDDQYLLEFNGWKQTKGGE